VTKKEDKAAAQEDPVFREVIKHVVESGVTIKDVQKTAKRLENAKIVLEAITAPAKPTKRGVKPSLSSVLDEVKSIVNSREDVTDVTPRIPSPQQKASLTMTTNQTATVPADAIAKPHVISAGVLHLADKIRQTITIDAATGVASFGTITFKDTLPDTLTEEEVSKTLNHMNVLAIAATHALGMEASKFTKKHEKLEHVTGKFPGPNRGAHLAVTYKPTTTMPSGDSTKVYKGTMVTSWKGIGGPGGNDFDAVKAAIRAASEADQAS
jgi:hypothetical protein